MSLRLQELMDRVCAARGSVAASLSASEWYELQQELSRERAAMGFVVTEESLRRVETIMEQDDADHDDLIEVGAIALDLVREVRRRRAEGS